MSRLILFGGMSMRTMKPKLTLDQAKQLKDSEIIERLATFDIARFECCRCSWEDDVTPAQATLIKYGAPFCSEECAERASDFTLEDGERQIPDYLSDLNAVRELELKLSAEQAEAENDLLYYEIVPKDMRVIYASARMRCLALIMVLANRP